MKVIVNPTWRCQFSCPYCWVRALGWHRRKEERPWQRWFWWLRQLPLPSHVEISGGEPLLYSGLLPLLENLGAEGLTWAMTTNLHEAPVLERLVRRPIKGCVLINVSIHPQSDGDLVDRVRRLRGAGYRVYLNRVDHPAAPSVPEGLSDMPVHLIPYQPWEEELACEGVVRWCSAGGKHLTCDPSGRVFRCMVHMQKGLAPLGSIASLAGGSLRKPILCHVGCTTCYRDNPSAWGLEMETVGQED